MALLVIVLLGCRAKQRLDLAPEEPPEPLVNTLQLEAGTLCILTTPDRVDCIDGKNEESFQVPNGMRSVVGCGNCVEGPAGRWRCRNLPDFLLGGKASSPQLEPLAPFDGASQLADNGYTGCFVRAGQVFCWGFAEQGGELGYLIGEGESCYFMRRTIPCSAVPRAVLGLDRADSIAHSNFNFCARKQDGTAWCWGTFIDGVPFGPQRCTTRGAREHAGVPCVSPQARQIEGLPWLAGIVGRGLGFWGVARDGALFAWGDKRDQDPYRARPVAGLSSVRKMTANCALQLDGRVRCLGNDRETWTEVPGVGPAVDIAEETYGPCAMKRDRSVWCSGSVAEGLAAGNPQPGGTDQSATRRVWPRGG